MGAIIKKVTRKSKPVRVAVLVLPLIWGLDGIWASIIVAELMAAALCGLFLVLKRKKYQYY